MKKKLAIIMIGLSSVAFSSTASAEDANACEVVLCMFGMLSGTNPSECSSAVRKYFSINVFSKRGFNPAKTAAKRLNLLNQCPSPENGNINAKFGTVRM